MNPTPKTTARSWSNFPLASTSPEVSKLSQTKKFWLFFTFLLCIFIPGSFQLGIQLAPYRIFLLLMIVPIVRQILLDRSLRITFVDIIFLFVIIWRPLAIAVNHFPGHAVLTVSLTLDMSLSYLFARVFIRSPNDFASFFKAFLLLILALFPFVIIESITGQRLLRNIFGFILNTREDDIRQFRFGLLRVKLGFGHAVLFGFVCMIAFSNLIFIYWRNKFKSLLAGTFIAISTLFAISSSSIIGLGIQLILIVNHIFIRIFSISWKYFLFVFTFLFIFISILSGFSYDAVVNYILGNLVLSEFSGRARSLQIEFGVMEVYNNPIFGLGQRSWAPPYWQSTSVDNYWLSITMKYGIPASFALAIAFIVHFTLIALSKPLSEEIYNFRVGYLITLASVFFTLLSVAIYHSTESYFIAFFAAGAWFYNPLSDERPAGRRPPLQRKPPPAGLRRPPAANNDPMAVRRPVSQHDRDVSAAPRTRAWMGDRPAASAWRGVQPRDTGGRR
jgi:hypothetical protein